MQVLRAASLVEAKHSGRKCFLQWWEERILNEGTRVIEKYEVQNEKELRKL
jgi:hypothetical protein